MSAIDVVIVAIVLAAVAGCVRYLLKSNKKGCSDCGNSGSCHGSCEAAGKMLADVDAAFAKKAATGAAPGAAKK